MSSALQPAPLQPTSISALNTPPLASASPSNRHYSSSHSSPTREGSGHHANQHTSGASPASSSRRPSRRPSAHDNSPMSSRAALASPAPVPVDQNMSTSERKRNMATAVPPRTSSTHHHSNGGSASRRAAQTSERATASPRRAAHGDSGRDPNGTADPSRGHHSSQEPPQRSGSSRESRSAGAHSSARSPPATASSRGPSREASEILNSILISQPEVDMERERERIAMAQAHQVGGLVDDDAAPPPVMDTRGHHEEQRRGGRSRHDHSKKERQTRFGEYTLGNTIGEGEFGKVKLGWKEDGAQVAIKLIKKDQLGSNPTRMAKIMREVAILKQLTHPNIVRLHKMEESERHYGIVLEYASGGELFDYILNHRYLKDTSARRLFAQLVSGVGYLHKKGIVHRDLKLENLLLDKNRNIIITDFGFANTFDPTEELTEEEELNLSDREFVKRMGLDKIKQPSGSRKGDLMQTSCGSPCYAAPELVVSDSLYTGRKVDVWSCGVILYAMLAGYLPFDDDPANPEGDNINLLYKYIVNTPLTFPEYVSPHARDLLRRILVPNPRKRADLFEVARHSWLSEYAHVVEFITSSTTTPGEIQNTTVPAEDDGETPMLARSASVRESSKKTAPAPAIGGLASKQGTLDAETEAAIAKQQRDNKRRTVQVEYVPPNTSTQRGEPPAAQTSGGRTRARSGSQGAVEVVDSGSDKPLPKDPPVSKDAYGKASVSSRRPPSAHRNQAAAPARTTRDSRAASEAAYMTSATGGSGARPATGGSISGRGVGAGGRASYGQPAPPEVADTNAHGRIQQPPRGSSTSYGVPSSSQGQQDLEYGRPSISVPTKFARVSGFQGEGGVPSERPSTEVKGHKRSSTMGEIGGKLFGRSGSLFGGRNRKRQEQQPTGEKTKRYPPVSMNNSIMTSDEPRVSMDSKRSRRSFSIGLGKKRSGSISGSATSQEKHARRFSFIPTSFSLKAIGIGKEDERAQPDSQQDLPIQEPPAVDQYGRYIDQNVGRDQVDASTLDGMYAQLHDSQQGSLDTYSGNQRQYPSNQYGRSSGPDVFGQGTMPNTGSDPSVELRRPIGSAPYNPAFQQDGSNDGRRAASTSTGKPTRGVLQKNKKFGDAWDTDSYSRTHDHSGSSGPARRVMDFFRRRGKARAENS